MRKRGIIAESLIPIFLILILTHVLITYEVKIDDMKENPLGLKQISLIRESQRARYFEQYISTAAKQSLDASISDAAMTAGFYDRSPCGAYGNFELWKNESDFCKPDTKAALGAFMEEHLDAHLEAYPLSGLYASNGRPLLDNIAITFNSAGGIIAVGSSKNPVIYGELYYQGSLEKFPVEEADAFTNTWHYPRSDGKRYHMGTDIPADKGKAVFATTAGKVTALGCNGYGGNRVGIIDSEGFYHYYAHLEKARSGLRIGSVVKAGEVIGTVGNTLGCDCPGSGGDTACRPDPNDVPYHLHYGIYSHQVIYEDIIGESSALNPYYALKSALKMEDEVVLPGYPSFEYRYSPSFKVKEDYFPETYDKLWDIMNAMSELYGSTAQYYADNLRSRDIGAELTVEQAQDPVRDEFKIEAGVPWEVFYEPDLVEKDGTTNYDWIIEYQGNVISEDENGVNEKDKWERWCEADKEMVIGSISEAYYDCSFTRDVDCLCEARKDTSFASVVEYEKSHPWKSLRVPDTTTEDISYYSYSHKNLTTNFGTLSSFTWMPDKIRLNSLQYTFTFRDEVNPPREYEFANENFALFYKKSKDPNQLGPDAPARVVWMQKDLENSIDYYKAVDDSFKVKVSDAKKCKAPDVIKVCVIDNNRKIVRWHLDDQGVKKIDYAPVVYRFAWHLRPKIPDKIESGDIDVQDKLRYKNSSVIKWPDVSFSEDSTYTLYYSRGTMAGFTKEGLDDIVKKTKDGDPLPQNRKEIYAVELRASDAEKQRGNIDTSFIYYNAPLGQRYYVSTIGEGQVNNAVTPPELDPYNVTELYVNKFYRFSNPHYVYVIAPVEDGVTYYFTIVGENELGEFTDEPLEDKEGISVNDAPPAPLQNIGCVLDQGVLKCTFDPLAVDVDFLQIQRTIINQQGDEEILDPERLDLTNVVTNDDGTQTLLVGGIGQDVRKVDFRTGNEYQSSTPPADPEQSVLDFLQGSFAGQLVDQCSGAACDSLGTPSGWQP